jgi:Tol biopolymer transport system component/DNA-binding winged helix-turn-helix (wHTH) protein
MDAEPANAACFGTFKLDLKAGELHQDGRTIRLQEQPFQVLRMLIEHPGEIVTREEIRGKLWPNDTIVEFDHSINAAIKKLRLALGDSAEKPHYVETVARRGYRFIAPVDESQASIAPQAPAFRRRWYLIWFAIACAFAVGVRIAGWWLHTNRTAEPTYVPVPLTSYPGDEWSPTFSPDGNQVAFTWHRAHCHIFVKLIGTDEPVQLTRDEADDFAPAWSPDGRFVAFLRLLPNHRSGVFLVPAPGGPVRKLAEVCVPEGAEEPELAWHPNGKWLVVLDKDIPGQPLALFLLSVETREKRRLTTPPKGIFLGDVGPAVSPDGRAVVFSRDSKDLFLLDLSEDLNPKSQLKQLTFDHRYTASPTWTPDGRAIVFSSGTPHNPTLYKLVLSQPGGRSDKPERLAFAGEGARQPAISRQGRLAYQRSTIDANIWRLRLNAGRPAVEPPIKLIASTHLDHMPKYSPDGTRIAFASDRSGSQEIWACNSDGSRTVQLTSFGGSILVTGPQWSADGRQIFFQAAPRGRFEAFVISSDGGTPHRVSGNSPFSGPDVNVSGYSHDGKWIYFDSRRTGESQVYKVPAEGGREIQITRKGGSDPQESSDGRFLYYVKGGKEITSLWRVPVEGGDETQVLTSVCCLNFAVMDQGIYFIPEPPPEGNSSVKFLNFATGKTTTIAKLSGSSGYGSSVSRDGKWLLYSQYEQKGADLVLVENFH